VSTLKDELLALVWHDVLGKLETPPAAVEVKDLKQEVGEGYRKDKNVSCQAFLSLHSVLHQIAALCGQWRVEEEKKLLSLRHLQRQYQEIELELRERPQQAAPVPLPAPLVQSPSREEALTSGGQETGEEGVPQTEGE